MRTSFLRSIFLLSVLFSFAVGGRVLAADPKPVIRDEAYSAKLISQSPRDPITIEAGKTTDVTLTFRNTGTATWQDPQYISAYTMEPRNRASVFASDDWISSHQTASMDATVKPGKNGTLVISLTAPKAPGEYVEHFYLAAENRTWVKGGYFFLKIIVTPAKVAVAPTPSPVAFSKYKANRFKQTVEKVTAKGGEQVEVTVGFQNTGDTAWPGYRLQAGSPSGLASVSQLSFADDVWSDPHTVLQKDTTVAPGDIVRETFTFRAPAKVGDYTATFNLVSSDGPIGGGVVEIPVTVTENAPEYIDTNAPIAPPAEVAPRFASEPRIRVGIWKKPDSFVQFRSEEDDYTVYDGDTVVGVLPRAKLGVFKYENNQYTFKGGDLEFATNNYIRLMPANDPHAVFYLWNMERVVKWRGGSRNFNQYRGGMEYRLTQNGTMYIINDLLLEDYVKGIAEASNAAPIEFLKAQAVASRTYAYFIANHSDKHDTRNFDVVATTGDQLYLGAVNEGIAPHFVEAVAATRGMMVTYEHNIVITPYFGHSNGKTRSWVQVWGGSVKPWLVPVKATYDKGLRRYGHGVGMSQRDAAIRAQKTGAAWDALIKYYYTGVEIEKTYE